MVPPAVPLASQDMDQAQLLACVCFASILALAVIKLPPIVYRVSHRQLNITYSLSVAAPLVLILVQLVITQTSLLFLVFNAPLAVMIAVVPPTATAAVPPISTIIAYAIIPVPVLHFLKLPPIALLAMNTALVAQCLPTIVQPVTPTELTRLFFSATSASSPVQLPTMAAPAPRPASLAMLLV